ncbi:NAD(P)/FAD-dependent oxidoreductase [Pseudidiomarina taiwanensis]|uniref:FAD-dependent oxidoreductase n=1 Tax=Pseudidiomarina taiwanensis TaxID=337250 RepID=A0A432ZMY7_9GAMM|nr:FAD-dependent oxidoreductase [Pseudidiomarina taiwanensis]RUO79253.1 FAD-dependent oxidoreductase [Pseudidiomarina taiwanensis]
MKIAVIGSGISGLTSAYLLHRDHEVTVFEKNDYIGGHTHTIPLEKDGVQYNVDTGFIVFNDRTYPYFRAMMREIGVQWRDTEMSFSVRDPRSGLEYNGHNFNTLFAQRKNFFKPSFYRLLGGIVKFNKAAKAANKPGANLDHVTLGEFLRQVNVSDDVAEFYLLPMVAAIWSASLTETEKFPLGFFLRFFENHGLLNVTDRPQWHTIIGGSSAYIEPLTRGFADKIQLQTKISRIQRQADEQQPVLIEFEDRAPERFDAVIFACHSDEALALLADPSADETQVLGAIPYQMNDVVLHTDASLLPRNERAWASWNYLLHHGADAKTRPSSVTYNMNILQGIQGPHTFCVTLNNTDAIAEQEIIGRYAYAHPVYSVESMQARAQRGEINGVNHTYFTGAYWYNGFHEDGVRSAVDVARMLGSDWGKEIDAA